MSAAPGMVQGEVLNLFLSSPAPATNSSHTQFKPLFVFNQCGNKGSSSEYKLVKLLQSEGYYYYCSDSESPLIFGFLSGGKDRN